MQLHLIHFQNYYLKIASNRRSNTTNIFQCINIDEGLVWYRIFDILRNLDIYYLSVKSNFSVTFFATNHEPNIAFYMPLRHYLNTYVSVSVKVYVILIFHPYNINLCIWTQQIGRSHKTFSKHIKMCGVFNEILQNYLNYLKYGNNFINYFR